jgi:hypothetical protein
MPFVSERQRRYLFAKEPEVAERFAKETPKGKKLPEKAKAVAKSAAAKAIGKLMTKKKAKKKPA